MLWSLSTRLWRLPSAWLALLILVSIFLSMEPSQDMMLPKYLKCSTLASGLLSMVMVEEGSGSMVQVGGSPPSFRVWLSGRGTWVPRRSGAASAAGLVLPGPQVHCRQQREPLGGEFAGPSSLLWVDAGRRESRPSGNEYRPLFPDLRHHRKSYRWKRRWKGPGQVRSPTSRLCWSRKHPSYCLWKDLVSHTVMEEPDHRHQLWRTPDAFKDCPKILSVDGVKSFRQVNEYWVEGLVLFNALLLKLSHSEYDVYSAPDRPDDALCLREGQFEDSNESVKDNSRKDLSCNWKRGDAPVVPVVRLTPLFLIEWDDQGFANVVWHPFPMLCRILSGGSLSWSRC